MTLTNKKIKHNFEQKKMGCDLVYAAKKELTNSKMLQQWCDLNVKSKNKYHIINTVYYITMYNIIYQEAKFYKSHPGFSPQNSQNAADPYKHSKNERSFKTYAHDDGDCIAGSSKDFKSINLI